MSTVNGGTVARRSRRTLLAPEVVQTSAMDCGPASLKCLLEGYGIPVSYGRLREACQTDVDGTSIDTLEGIGNQLGLHAEQVMVPTDHLFAPDGANFPSLIVVRQPNGFTHFVVLWRAVGGFVQVMDPATGRRWMTRRSLLEQLYVHDATVPASEFRAWAGSDDFLGPLRHILKELGAGSAARGLIDDACSDEGWLSLGALDAAARMVSALVRSGGIARGSAATRLVGALFIEARKEWSPEGRGVPIAFWSARPPKTAAAPPTSTNVPGALQGGEPTLRIRGAVLLRVRPHEPGQAPEESPEPRPERTFDKDQQPALSRELAAALSERPARPGRDLLALLAADGALTPLVVLGALLLAVGGAALEAVLLRSIFDFGQHLGIARQRAFGAIALVGFMLALLAVELPLAASVLRLGRHLEARLRVAFLSKVPRLGDRYFQSRPISDMAERVHSVQHLRLLPELGAEFIRAGLALLCTTLGLIWLDPASAPAAIAAAVAAVGIPIALAPLLVERDLRMRSHAGSLGHFYLDALLGLVAIRTHAAEDSVRHEHEALLVEWARAGRSALRAAVAVDLFQTAAGLLFAGWLFTAYLSRSVEPGGVLLFAWWALELPALGQQIALAVRQYPMRRNITLRLLEPLGAPEAGDDLPAGSVGLGAAAVLSAQEISGGQTATMESAAAGPAPQELLAGRGVALRFEGVSVVAAGHRILEELSLTVEPGSHVAVVGPSGAGKSSFVGLLLGWHRAAAGRILCDGVPLEPQRLERLRSQVAWVDPAVQLWNRSLLENLCYSSDGGVDRVAGVLDAADLHRVIAGLPDGLQSTLGESGALVSGGEGQRVRLGRAMLQSGVRLALLDEPFRGLDRETRRALMARARRYFAGATMFCVTHDVGETLGFSRVLVIEDGRIVEDDAPAVLAARADSHYRTLLDAEESVRVGLWSSSAWRRLQLDGGRLVERPRAGDAALADDASPAVIA